VTVTRTVPAPGGLTAVIVVELTTTTWLAMADPKCTVALALKFVPLIVTFVPQRPGPVEGDTLVTVGRE
jgi:hypothetical protein